MSSMKAAATILLLRVLALLPLRVSRLLGIVVGQFCWWTKKRMAITTLTNLALCFPQLGEKYRTQLARLSILQTFQTIIETGAVWLWPAQKTLSLIKEVEGLELLQSAKAAGKGVLVLVPHIGNWEIFGLYLNACGCGQSSQLYKEPASKQLNDLIYRARSRAGAKMVATNHKGVAVLLQTLRRGEIVAILPDQVPPDSGGLFAPFYGIPALTMTLLNKLQQKTGAQIVVGFAIRSFNKGKPEFTIKFQSPDPKIYAEHITEGLAAMNRTIEQAISAAPAQYQWEYKRFKRRPIGEAEIY